MLCIIIVLIIVWVGNKDNVLFGCVEVMVNFCLLFGDIIVFVIVYVEDVVKVVVFKGKFELIWLLGFSEVLLVLFM